MMPDRESSEREPIQDQQWIERESSAAENYRRRREHAMTPQQRLEAAGKLQQQAMELLMASPEAYQAYVRRNHRARRALTDEEVDRRYRQSHDRDHSRRPDRDL